MGNIYSTNMINTKKYGWIRDIPDQRNIRVPTLNNNKDVVVA